MNKVTMPAPDKDGRVQTLNNMGAMSPEIDPISKAFLDNLEGNILDVGPAYGNVAMEAFKNTNFTSYVAVDLDPNHLNILYERVSSRQVDVSKLKLVTGDFPDGVKLEYDSFHSILIARVLHFFSPEKIELAITTTYNLLENGGCVYVVAITPYTKKFASFIPVYEQRLEDEGNDWPGFIDDLQQYADRNITSAKNYKDLSKKPFHFFSASLLNKTFQNHGFTVIQAEEYPLAYHSDVWGYDGRENVGVIACKISGVSEDHDGLVEL